MFLHITLSFEGSEWGTLPPSNLPHSTFQGRRSSGVPYVLKIRSQSVKILTKIQLFWNRLGTIGEVSRGVREASKLGLEAKIAKITNFNFSDG